MLQLSSINKLTSFFQQYKLLQYKKKTLILHSNDSASSVFFVKSGYIRVFRISEDGEELTLTILKEYDFFPLTYGFNNNNEVNNYYLEAITSLEIWKSPQEQFMQFIKKDPELFFELANTLMVKFDVFLTRMEYLVFNNAYTKVAATLLMCAKDFGEQHGNEIIVKIPLTHKDIATMIGITRETTSLEMKKLEKKGFVRRSGKFLIIKNYNLLKEETLHSLGSEEISLPYIIG